MAFALAQDKFLWSVDLKWGAYTYTFLMLFGSLFYMFWPTLSIQDWIAFVGVCCPGAAFFGLFMYDWKQEKFGYVWANWYFAFFGWILGSVYIIWQTITLSLMIKAIGDGEIRFRKAELGNPLGPNFMADEYTSLVD